MTYYMRNGNSYNVSAKNSLDIHEELPAATYTVRFDQMRGVYFLEQINDFEIKGKVYGDATTNMNRILDTFNDRTQSTGVLLSGEKGSGKTLLTKLLSLEAMKSGVPTIVINEPWCGEGFNTFMQMIEQPTIVLFDEFEKVYGSDDQEKMLTLLDGVYPSKKLFLITSNDNYRINNHMKNRPGRIFYRLEYKGLENDFIVEYCQDNLKAKEHIDSICRLALMFDQFNFDMLKALVEEMNRYGETPQQAIKLLNAKPDQGTSSRYNLELVVGGKKVTEEMLDDGDSWVGNPLGQTIMIDYAITPIKGADDDDAQEWFHAVFQVSDLDHIDAGKGKFEFKNSDGDKLSLVKVKAVESPWVHAF